MEKLTVLQVYEEISKKIFFIQENHEIDERWELILQYLNWCRALLEKTEEIKPTK